MIITPHSFEIRKESISPRRAQVLRGERLDDDSSSLHMLHNSLIRQTTMRQYHRVLQLCCRCVKVRHQKLFGKRTFRVCVLFFQRRRFTDRSCHRMQLVLFTAWTLDDTIVIHRSRLFPKKILSFQAIGRQNVKGRISSDLECICRLISTCLCPPIFGALHC